MRSRRRGRFFRDRPALRRSGPHDRCRRGCPRDAGGPSQQRTSTGRDRISRRLGLQFRPEGGIPPSLADIEAVADALGGRQVSAGEFSGDIPLDSEDALERAAKALRANADRLAEKGLLVALESFPWSALANTRIAIDLLRRADAPNAGLLIDVWHFYNGGNNPDQLTELPNAGVTGVQLNDGPLVHENFLQHISDTLARPTSYPQLAELLQQLYDTGTATPELLNAVTGSEPLPPETGDEPYLTNRADAYSAIQCSDSTVPTDPAVYSRAARDADRSEPDFGRIAVFSTIPCAFWQGHDADRYTGPWNRRTSAPNSGVEHQQ